MENGSQDQGIEFIYPGTPNFNSTTKEDHPPPRLLRFCSPTFGPVPVLVAFTRGCTVVSSPDRHQLIPRVFRFLHTADWQVGKPYRHIRTRPNALYWRERLAVIQRIAARRGHQVDAVLVAGDLFDSPTPTSGVLLEVLEAIGAMDVPVLVIPGNHDHGGAGSVWHRDDLRRHQPELAANLQVLLQRRPVELEQAVILPCPLLRQRDSRDPTFWLRDRNWDALAADKPRILLAHGGIQVLPHGITRTGDRHKAKPESARSASDSRWSHRLHRARRLARPDAGECLT